MLTKKVRITTLLFGMRTGTIQVGTELVIHQVESGAWQVAEPLSWRGVAIPHGCFEELPVSEPYVQAHMGHTNIVQPAA